MSMFDLSNLTKCGEYLTALQRSAANTVLAVFRSHLCNRNVFISRGIGIRDRPVDAASECRSKTHSVEKHDLIQTYLVV